MQIESPGTEYNSPRTGYPSTIINPGDSPDILATKERFISTLPDNEGRRTRETREKRGRGRKREREGQVGPRNMRAENRAPTGSDGNNGQSWPRFPSSGKRANELSNVIEPEGSLLNVGSTSDASSIGFPVSSFPEQDVSPSSADCDEDWQLRRSRSIWYWKLETFQITIGESRGATSVGLLEALRARSVWPARLISLFLIIAITNVVVLTWRQCAKPSSNGSY